MALYESYYKQNEVFLANIELFCLSENPYWLKLNVDFFSKNDHKITLIFLQRYPYRKVKEPTSYQDGDCWYLGGESRWRHILDEFQNHTSMFQSETPNGLFNWHHNGCTASLTSEGSVTISIHDGDETFHWMVSVNKLLFLKWSSFKYFCVWTSC